MVAWSSRDWNCDEKMFFKFKHQCNDWKNCLGQFLVTHGPQTKLLEGKLFTLVCHSFCSQGGCILACNGQELCIPAWNGQGGYLLLGQGGKHPLDTSRQTSTMGKHAPPQDGHWSGRYASYWNVFLLPILLPLLSYSWMKVQEIGTVGRISGVLLVLNNNS